jgi:RNA polymerase sigma-70 factor (ECF subfamily)
MDCLRRAAMHKMSEDELVALAQSGDREAFAELVRRNGPLTYRTAVGILRDREDAADEAQNAWRKAWQGIGQFQQEAKFSTWLTRIVVNQCLMRLRETRRAGFVYLDAGWLGDTAGPLELPEDRPDPERETSRKEIADLLDSEIRRIPPLLRNVLLMRHVEERPLNEIAASLGISVPAAKSRLLRARAELRSRLERKTRGAARKAF